MESAQLSFLPSDGLKDPGPSDRDRARCVLLRFANLSRIRLAKDPGRMHFDHETHANFLEVLRSESGRLAARREEVYAVLEAAGRPLTDREVLAETSYPELNCVQPRITELIKSGMLFEFGRTKCGVTGKTVRVSAIALDREGRETAVFAAWKQLLEVENEIEA